MLLVFAGLITLLALALVLAPVDLRQAATYAAGHPFEVTLALLAYTVAFALRAVSWRSLVGARFPFTKLFALLMGALFLNHAAPAKAGDLARAYVLARWLPAEKAVVSVVLSRLVDLAGLLVVLVVSLVLAGTTEWGGILLPVLSIAGIAISLVLLACFRLPALFGTYVGAFTWRAQTALRETTPLSLAKSLAFAAPAWVLESGILLVVGWGLGLGLSAAEVVASTCFAVLVAAVPLTPGSIGTYEAGMVAILLAFGVPAESAFAAAVTTHAMKFLYALAAAPFAFGEGLAAVRKGESRTDEAGVKV